MMYDELAWESIRGADCGLDGTYGVDVYLREERDELWAAAFEHLASDPKTCHARGMSHLVMISAIKPGHEAAIRGEIERLVGEADRLVEREKATASGVLEAFRVAAESPPAGAAPLSLAA